MNEKEGVFERGRIGQRELLKEKEKCSVHYYICNWPEVDCISVRESAIAGCVPVVSNRYAFSTKNYCMKVDGNPNEKSTQVEAATKIVELLKDQEKLHTLSQEYRSNALCENWEAISQRWFK